MKATKLLTTLVTLAIMTIVLLPGGAVSRFSIGHLDKLYHLAMFGGWAIVVRYDFDTSPFRFWRYFVIGAGFALLTEVLQIFTDDRSFDPADLVADVAGLILGFLGGERLLRAIGLIR